MARTSAYNPKYHPQQAKRYCLLGYTNKELAQVFGISQATLYNWKKQYLEFLEACKEGKEFADAEVAQAFYKRAVGFTYSAEKIITISLGNGCSVVKRVPTTVVILANASAALKWLQNRQPEKWRDKVNVNHTGKIDTNDLSSLSDEQLQQHISELNAKTIK